MKSIENYSRNEKRLGLEVSSHSFGYFSFWVSYILQALISTVNIPALETVTSKPSCITRGKIDKVCPLQVISRGKICLIQ